MKIKKSYPINKLSDKNVLKLSDLCTKYMSKILGVNNRKKTPLSITIDDDTNATSFGVYDAFINNITIYTKHSNTIEEFISTFIHEYTHYTQPIRTKYYKLYKQFGYDNHPHEIHARDNEIKLFPILYNNIKNHFS